MDEISINDWVEYSNTRGVQRGQVKKVNKSTFIVKVNQFGKGVEYDVKKHKCKKIDPKEYNLESI